MTPMSSSEPPLSREIAVSAVNRNPIARNWLPYSGKNRPKMARLFIGVTPRLTSGRAWLEPIVPFILSRRVESRVIGRPGKRTYEKPRPETWTGAFPRNGLRRVAPVLRAVAERHRQRLQPVDAAREPALPGHLAGEGEPGEPAQQRAERDVGLHPGQRRAQAVVDAVAEREVRVVAPRDVEPLRLGELGVVAVGRAPQDLHDLTGRNG